MGLIDLDAARAAREERNGSPHQIIWGGETFLVGPELDLEAYGASRIDDPLRFVQLVLGSEQWPKFNELRRPSVDDARALSEGFAQLIGFESPGESSASLASSKSNSKRSKPTSNGSTDSTSETSSGDPLIDA